MGKNKTNAERKNPIKKIWKGVKIWLRLVVISLCSFKFLTCTTLPKTMDNTTKQIEIHNATQIEVPIFISFFTKSTLFAHTFRQKISFFVKLQYNITLIVKQYTFYKSIHAIYVTFFLVKHF